MVQTKAAPQLASFTYLLTLVGFTSGLVKAQRGRYDLERCNSIIGPVAQFG